MFSIQSASTGPSNTIHSRLLGSQDESNPIVFTFLIIEDAKPSYHSYVKQSISPYNSPIVIHFGFRT